MILGTFVSLSDLHRDLEIAMVIDVTNRFALQMRLTNHIGGGVSLQISK